MTLFFQVNKSFFPHLLWIFFIFPSKRPTYKINKKDNFKTWIRNLEHVSNRIPSMLKIECKLPLSSISFFLDLENSIHFPFIFQHTSMSNQQVNWWQKEQQKSIQDSSRRYPIPGSTISDERTTVEKTYDYFDFVVIGLCFTLILSNFILRIIGMSHFKNQRYTSSTKRLNKRHRRHSIWSEDEDLI